DRTSMHMTSKLCSPDAVSEPRPRRGGSTDLARPMRDKLMMERAVDSQSPGGEQRFGARLVERPVSHILLQLLAIALMGPGMPSVHHTPTVPHGQKRLRGPDSERGDPSPDLIHDKPHIFMLRKRPERTYLPIFACEQQRGARDITVHRPAHFPARHIEEQKPN